MCLLLVESVANSSAGMALRYPNSTNDRFPTILTNTSTLTMIVVTEKNDKKALLLKIINDVRAISESSESLIICLYLTIKGSQLIAIIKEFYQLLDISPQLESKVGLIVAIVHFCYAFIVNVVNTSLFIDSPIIRSRTQAFYGLVFFLMLNARLTVLSLILYMNCIVRKQISDMTENVSNKTNLKNVYLFASKLNDLTKKFDSVTSFYNLVIVSLNSIMCMSYVCVLAINPIINKMDISALTESLLTLMCLCLVSDIIPKAYKEFVHKLNKTFTEYSVENSDSNFIYIRIILSHMNDMRNDMSFTVYSICRVNTNTFLSCLTLILTYSVILIQTN